VPGNGHEEASVGHNISQDSQVAVVDVGAVEFDHATHLTEELIARRLHTEHRQHLWHVIAHSAGEVHIRVAQYLLQINSFRIQHPL
jgi:hypothetical protein